MKSKWNQQDIIVNKKILSKQNPDRKASCENEMGDKIKKKNTSAKQSKQNKSSNQDDEKQIKQNRKSFQKSQMKNELKMKQIEENTTLSNSALCSNNDLAENSDMNTSQFQQSSSLTKTEGSQSNNNDKKGRIRKSSNKKQDQQEEKSKESTKKQQIRKKKENSSQKKDEQSNDQEQKQQNNSESMSILEKVFKNNTLFKDCLDPTKGKPTEEAIKKNKIKIISGVPQYPNTNDSNRQNLMKQWWKYVNDYYFKEITIKDKQALQFDEISSPFIMGEQIDDPNQIPASKNYRYEKQIYKSKIQI